MNWWKNGLQLKLQMRIYPDGLLIAAIYALACWATRQVSVDQFYLGAGIRVSALLLCPPRLWPYLLLGEYAYFAHMRLPMIDSHGAVWVALGSVLLMPTAMYLVKLHYARIRSASDVWMLSLAISVAASITLLNVAMSQMLWPVPPSLPPLSRRYAICWETS